MKYVDEEKVISLIFGDTSKSAKEEAEGNIDEANRLRAEADRLEKLEDNSGGRVDYSDEVNELETKAAKEGSAPSSTEELTAHQESLITADAEKLFKQYLKENNLTEDDVIGKDFMKILDYIMKNSSTKLAEEATVDAIPQRSTDKEAAKEAFAKSRRSFKK